MKVTPDSRISVVAGEPLKLDSTTVAASASFVLKLGDPVDVVAVNGTVTVPAIEAPDNATVKWFAEGATEPFATTYAEIVDSYYFPLSALAGYGDGRDGFDELDEETLFAARQAATEVFERNAHRSFVHRLGRTKDYGRGWFLQLVDNDVYELVTEGYFLVSGSSVRRGRDAVAFPLWVDYKYGCDAIPAEVSRAVLELAAYMLRPTNRPVGATGESTDAGYIHFTTAGRDGATDIPEVNAAIEQFGAGVTYLW